VPTLSPVEPIVEVVDLLRARRPEVVVLGEPPVEGGGAPLLRAEDQEVGQRVERGEHRGGPQVVVRKTERWPKNVLSRPFPSFSGWSAQDSASSYSSPSSSGRSTFFSRRTSTRTRPCFGSGAVSSRRTSKPS